MNTYFYSSEQPDSLVLDQNWISKQSKYDTKENFYYATQWMILLNTILIIKGFAKNAINWIYCYYIHQNHTLIHQSISLSKNTLRYINSSTEGIFQLFTWKNFKPVKLAETLKFLDWMIPPLRIRTFSNLPTWYIFHYLCLFIQVFFILNR